MLEFFRSETIERVAEVLSNELQKNTEAKNNTVTNAQLLKLLALPESDGPILTALIKRELSHKFDVKLGRHGGFVLKNTDKKELNAA